MANRLRSCKECDHEVFIKAKTCPNCGVTKPGVPAETLAETLGGLTVVAIIIGGIYFFVQSDDKESIERGSTVVDDAYRACSAMEGTRLITTCEVSGWDSTVDVRIDTNGAEARKICVEAVKMIRKISTKFTESKRAGIEWRLRIFSPYSSDRPIAACTLL